MASPRIFRPLFVVPLLLAAAGAGYYFWEAKPERPPEVLTTTVTRGDITQVVTATGTLQTPRSVDISSQISGQITEVLVDFNSPVKQGDVLARIDPATYDSRLRQARAQLANSEANAQLTRLNAQRTRELFNKGLVSQQDIDQADALLTQAEAQLKIQQANVVNAEVDLSRCTILAPIDGIVLDRQCDVGKTVAASFNAPTLFTLVTDLKKLQINADISEADVGNVSAGQEVTFTVDAFPNRTFNGRVRIIRNLPKTSQSVVVYSTIIDVDNDSLHLKPGMTANVSVIVAKRTGVLRIANAALRARIDASFQPPPPAAPSPAPGATPAPAPAAPADPTKRREQMRELFREVGISFESGPPSPEQIAQVRKLAAERGIELPERFGNRARGGQGGEPAIQSRTVYRQRSALPNLQLEAVSAKLGVTDGSFTEVIEGLSEGDTLVSSVFVSTSAPAAGASAASPFAPQFPGRR